MLLKSIPKYIDKFITNKAFEDFSKPLIIKKYQRED